MEAMQRLRAGMAEVAENPKAAMHHLKEDVEDRVFEHLLKRRSSGGSSNNGSTITTVSSDTSSFSSSSSSSRSGESDVADEKAAGAGDGGVSTEQLDNGSVYLDKNEGTETESSQINGKVEGLGFNRTDIQEVMTILHGKAVGGTSAGPSKEEHEETADLGEDGDEEVVLEFETAVQTMHTHAGYGMYCPNCSNQITRVVLRRKIRRVVKKEDRPLVGCLSCFSIFIPSGNKLNPLQIFDSGESTQLHSDSLASAKAEGRGCNPLWIFRREKHPEDTTEVQRPRDPSPTEESTEKPGDVVIQPGKRFNVWWLFGNGKDQASSLTSPLLAGGAPGLIQTADTVIIDVENPGNVPDLNAGAGPQPGVTPSSSVGTHPSIQPVSGGSRSVEIVKSVVYGGLMESMASLSVVSSAAASDSTTMNIVVLGLANLVGGLVVLFHNLKDLRYGEADQTEEEIEVRYKKELGKRQHFPLHVFLAIVSYLIFGLLPPAIYGSTFRETNDRDYKMLAVAAASLLSVFMLAIGKAYARGEQAFTGYLKTVSYYISSAVMVAGISFAVGELAERLVQQLGWLDPPAPVSGMQFQPTWASSSSH